MPKVTYRAKPVVWIDIRGEKHPDNTVIRVRDDGGLIRRLNEFLCEKEIYPTVSSGSSGGGHYSKGYSVGDAEKIVAWLERQGCKKRRGP